MYLLYTTQNQFFFKKKKYLEILSGYFKRYMNEMKNVLYFIMCAYERLLNNYLLEFTECACAFKKVLCI